ncbi:hypothetical protein SCP_0703870 [Sparassis crispa]|uniref:Uncharacterized protein n=1 Tax=Sparassis crispa TaxID=139825 RepID=A0A401GSI6_9APHY|nr:hypothetical protein SCP_0703870 [Sparassis crispa]GBE85201.1 hypothetical protein SCP_0703870 [Sparassis crispa]
MRAVFPKPPSERDKTPRPHSPTRPADPPSPVPDPSPVPPSSTAIRDPPHRAPDTGASPIAPCNFSSSTARSQRADPPFFSSP